MLGRLNHKHFIADSSSSAGAVSVSSDGSSFTVELEEALLIDGRSKNVTLSVISSTQWNNIDNISAALSNNMFRITGPRESDDALTQYDITIEDGLYEAKDLENTIIDDLAAAGAKVTGGPLVNFIVNYSTQKIEFLLNHPSTTMDFTIPNSIKDVIGANATTYSQTVQTSFENEAQFNNVEYLLIHSDLVGRGVNIGGKYSQTIMKVPISADSLNVQFTHSPDHLIKVDANGLIGTRRSKYRVWITNQNNVAVTMSESWSIEMTISWET